MTSRRTFLRLAGTTAVVLAAGAGGWLATRTPTGAIAPWDPAATPDLSDADPRVRAFAHAILAPNPHNRQPWIIDLREPGRAVVGVDLERLLPETDPPSRQITIGLGCFLETLRLAASAAGVTATIAPFPEGSDPARLDSRPVAHVVFTAGATADPLAEQILRRHSVKEPFAMDRLPSADTIAAIVGAADTPGVTLGVEVEPTRVAAFRDLLWRGHEVEATTPAKFKESVDLMRIGRAEIEANPDGIDLGGPFLETLSVLGQLSRAQLADPSAQAFAQGMDIYREMLAATPAGLWLRSRSNDRPAQLAVGRAWVRAHLESTRLGVALHPVSQTLQEYAEMDALRAEMRALLGVGAGETLQLVARMGFGPQVSPSPRWPLAAKRL